MAMVVIKYFAIIICSIYSYKKLLNLNNLCLFKKLLSFGFSLVSAFAIYSIRNSQPSLSVLIMITITCIFTTLLFGTQPELSISTIILSFGISYIVNAISVCIIGMTTLIIIKILLYNIDAPTTEIAVNIITTSEVAILQCLLILLPFRLKRLRKGMPFLYKIAPTNAGVFVSIVLLCLVIVLGSRGLPQNMIAVLYSLILLCSVFVFLWWHSRIKQTYIESLRISEIEALQNEVSEKEKEINILQKNNEALSKMIHSDNKLIPAMKIAVSDFILTSANTDKQELQVKGKDLITYIDNLARDRFKVIQEYQLQNKSLVSIGVLSLDALMEYMLKKASEYYIKFDLTISIKVKDILESVISETDLNILLADLLENAIIATKLSGIKAILTNIAAINDKFLIEVLDSGVPFQTEHTTHAEEGGSGIGLMSVYEITQKYQASIIIDEEMEKSGFTKKISILFDGNKQFKIITNRSNDLKAVIERDDLIIVG